MDTIEAVVEYGNSLSVRPNMEMHFLTDVRDDVDRHRLGYFTYQTKHDPEYRKQRFCLTVSGSAYTVREHKEIDLIVSLGDYLENAFSADYMSVVEINLPKAHGYSGITYGHKTTRRLFEHAGIR